MVPIAEHTTGDGGICAIAEALASLDATDGDERDAVEEGIIKWTGEGKRSARYLLK